MNNDILILCGGLGTRLRNVIQDLPKPMAPVNGRPFLSYLLDQVAQAGAKRVILSVGYKHEAISSFFGSSYQTMEILYAIEESPLGTGGGLQYACQYVQTPYVTVLNGDSFIETDLLALERFHLSQVSEGAQISMVLKKMVHFDRYGTVKFNAPWVEGFFEKKPVEKGWINTGVYAFSPSLFSSAPKAPFSFEKEILEKQATLPFHIAAMPCSGRFIDIGIPQDYERAQSLFPLKTLPLISIITVCFNAQDLIERTFLSVCQQSYKHIEYLIIDGASKDNTLPLIRKLQSIYPQCHIRVFSEADHGIYDAMNKGLSRAKGDFVWFLNAGDTIAHKETTEEVVRGFSSLASPVLIVYGETLLVNEKGESLGLRRHRAPQNLNWKSFRKGMLVCHQSIWINPHITSCYHWQLYPGAADIDWIIQALKQCRDHEIYNSHSILSHFLVGGYSSQHEKQSWNERYHIMVKHYGLLCTWWNHLYIIGRRILRNIFS